MKCLRDFCGVCDVQVKIDATKQNLRLWRSPTRRSGSFLVSQLPQNKAGKCECPTTEVVLMVAFPVTELYFLIAKFLSGGPLKETAKVNSMKMNPNIIIVSIKSLNITFSVADFAKRTRERRGELVLFLVPGLSLYCCFGRERTWLRLSNFLKVC